ncbi:MAG: GNAT family N-acetyltransferase [Clostridia bacterium]|nr:GNAT family N-acetyltransferase [Clostridia bacterium]
MVVRNAVAADAAELCALCRDEMGYEYPMDAFAGKLDVLLQCKTDRIFTAEENGRVVGFVHACDYDVLYAPHMKNIMGIAVSSDFRGQGIGRALLGAVEAWAEETGAVGIRLTSGESRTGAHAFYRACGYEYTKTQFNFRKLLTTGDKTKK